MPPRFNSAQMTEIVQLYFSEGRCARKAAKVYSDAHPGEPRLDYRLILRTVRRFQQSGSVAVGVPKRGHVVRSYNLTWTCYCCTRWKTAILPSVKHHVFLDVARSLSTTFFGTTTSSLFGTTSYKAMGMRIVDDLLRYLHQGDRRLVAQKAFKTLWVDLRLDLTGRRADAGEPERVIGGAAWTSTLGW